MDKSLLTMGIYVIIIMVSHVGVVCAVHQFKHIPLRELLQRYTGIEFFKCHDRTAFQFEPFPWSYRPDDQPAHGFLDETFVTIIPFGRVCSSNGWVLVDDLLITELLWKDFALAARAFHKIKLNSMISISGRVAVVAQWGYNCYYHWICEVLGRLALLEMQGVAYDWLYAPCNLRYMKETLQLWGIDGNKLIDSSSEQGHYIQADQLVVPSLVGHIQGDHARYASYNHADILKYVKTKLLSAALLHDIDMQKFSKKVFISRQDAGRRRVINEDEVFALFEQQGFQRYTLADMSVVEQILLFHNAQTIVAFHGAGLANILFCKPNTKLIEIFQTRGDSTYWYMSQVLGIEALSVPTVPFSLTEGRDDTLVPLETIEKLLDLL